MDPLSSLSSLALPLGDTLLAQSGPDAIGAPTASPGTAQSSGSFAQTLVDAIGSLAGLQSGADAAVAGVAGGRNVDIHQAMIAMEQASLGMQLAVQVRDKGVEAYQSLLNMQV